MPAVALAVIALVLAFPVAPASAATTVGQDFIPQYECQPSGGGTYLQSGVSSGNPYAMPEDGVITSWSFHSGASPAIGLKLKVLRPEKLSYEFGYTNWEVVGESQGGPTAALEAATFPARVPVRRGDVLGVYMTGGDCTLPTVLADYYQGWEKDLAVGSTEGASYPYSGSRIPVSASLEPDADHDGFGDQTQDGCPSEATHGPCADRTPPGTSIVKGPKRRTAKAKAAFQFSSTEPGSTFGCRLDGKFGFAACGPTEKIKVARGKHKLEVRAVDAAGNADPTPSSYAWTVVKKKHKRPHRP